MTVTAVLDGDTIDVVPGGRIRLLGIDAPETGGRYEHPAPFARQARARLASLVLRRAVRLESDVELRDGYGRTLAYVLTEQGDCVNILLVREGLARVSARRRLVRLDDLQRAEAEARRLRRGLWGPPPPEVGAEQFLIPAQPNGTAAARRARCGALTKTGARCRRLAVEGAGYCAQHRQLRQRR